MMALSPTDALDERFEFRVAGFRFQLSSFRVMCQSLRPLPTCHFAATDSYSTAV